MWRQHHKLLKKAGRDGKKDSLITRFIEGEVEKRLKCKYGLRCENIEGIESSIPIITSENREWQDFII